MRRKMNTSVQMDRETRDRENERKRESERITHRIFQASTQKHRPLKMFYALYIYYQERKANQNKK